MNVPPTNAEPDINPASGFDAIDFKELRSVVVAVSGGSDSLALLHLLISYRATQSTFPEIIAVTIDHGLRPESADEAHFVAGLCKTAGIAHRILNWDGPKPDTGLSAKAREVRYKLLCRAARDADTDMVLAGHTLDDQIETFVMRSARTGKRGSERGLAGMALATLLDREVWLLRPLLDVSREKLRDYLRARGITWRNDPSNDNPKYERVRIRKALRLMDNRGIAGEVVVKASKRRALNDKVARVLPDCVTIYDGIRAEVSRADLGLQEQDVQQLVVAILMATMGGQSYLPPVENCDGVLEHIHSKRSSGRITMNRCVIQLRKDKVLIYREMRSLPSIVLDPGRSVVWDGRYQISNHTNKPMTITATGDKGLGFLGGVHNADFHRPSALSSPAVVVVGEIAGIPAIGDHMKVPNGISVTRYLALFDHILSGYDEILAQSVAETFQLQGYKRSPVNQINKN
ncbi:tRNA lysidine(34) synthetase TilS [Phyllobacterium bourgognense]|uniref:tRNA(Ile)-lysidine synthase n=1 Tax=Phyllobacterium bourgognense TaxID=314236 RepID=A0A368YJX4_9HYPH|nr:tRNA lysidine(34) synthetase TilS [Phyllobacterium bourgognense]RCW80553.1 tRNA(Ile)-lysidine synthase [Phyllobacterium bourgognense]